MPLPLRHESNRVDKFYCQEHGDWCDVFDHKGICKPCFNKLRELVDTWKSHYCEIAQRFEHLRNDHDATLKELEGVRNQNKLLREQLKNLTAELQQKEQGQ